MSAAREAKRNYPLLLLSMVALELLLTWAHPWADPPRGFGAEESLDRGGYRYLAEARGWAQGTENDAQDGYRKPLVSIPAWLFYRLFGVNAASSRALAAIGSLGSLLLLAALLRRRHGDRIALLGAALLLLDAPWRAFVRSPAIDPWASLWLLGVLALGSGRVPWRRIASVVGLIAGATLLKPILWLGLPALLAEEGIRLARARKQSAREGARPIPPRELLAGLGTILLLLPWLWRLLKAAVGVLPEAGDPSPGSAGNGVDLLSAAPVLLPLAWVGLLLFITHVFATPGPSRPLERMAHITVWGGLVVFLASGGTPLHGLVSMTPLVVYLAAATVDRACHLDRSRPLPLRGLRGGLLVGAGVPGTLLLAYALRESSLASPFAWGTLAVAGGGVAILFGFGFPWLPVSIRRRFLLPLFLLIAVGPSLPELARMLGHPSDSIRRADRELANILLPTAGVGGAWAQALTIENQMRARPVGEPLRGRVGSGAPGRRDEVSHILMERDSARGPSLEAGGGGLELVEVLHVGGRPVGLYRRASSGVGRSAFEEGVAFTREGRLVEARWRFSMVLKGNPRSAAAWARIGEALLGEGEAERAFRCFLRAIEGDPQSVRAHIALADLYMGRGRLEETIHHLKAAARAEPSSSDLNELLTRLEERIGEK